MLVPSNDGLTQGCPASPAAFSFLILLVEEFIWPELVARAGEEAKDSQTCSPYLDGLTLVTEVRYLEDATRAMESALSKARLIVNEMKGHSPDIHGHETRRRESRGHVGQCRGSRGFRRAGCLGAVDDQSSQAPTPIPVGNSSYIERFIQKRAEVIRGLSQEITATRRLASQRYRLRAAC